MSNIKEGDVVRVRDPDAFIQTFARKVRDRDAVVQRVFQRLGANAWMCRCEFQKRNGRGKPFVELISAHALVLASEIAK